MTDFSDLQNQNHNADIQNRKKYLTQKSDLELAAMLSNGQMDIRDYQVARKLLQEHGVTGLPL